MELDDLNKVYDSVIDDVIENLKENWQEEGLEDEVLEELRSIWKSKLNKNGRDVPGNLAIPLEMPFERIGNSSNFFQNFMEQHYVPVEVTVPMESSGILTRTLSIQVPVHYINNGNLNSLFEGPIISATMGLSDTLATTLLQQHVNTATSACYQPPTSQKIYPEIINLDGTIDSGDENEEIGKGTKIDTRPNQRGNIREKIWNFQKTSNGSEDLSRKVSFQTTSNGPENSRNSPNGTEDNFKKVSSQQLSNGSEGVSRKVNSQKLSNGSEGVSRKASFQTTSKVPISIRVENSQTSSNGPEDLISRRNNILHSLLPEIPEAPTNIGRRFNGPSSNPRTRFFPLLNELGPLETNFQQSSRRVPNGRVNSGSTEENISTGSLKPKRKISMSNRRGEQPFGTRSDFPERLPEFPEPNFVGLGKIEEAELLQVEFNFAKEILEQLQSMEAENGSRNASGIPGLQSIFQFQSSRNLLGTNFPQIPDLRSMEMGSINEVFGIPDIQSMETGSRNEFSGQVPNLRSMEIDSINEVFGTPDFQSMEADSRNEFFGSPEKPLSAEDIKNMKNIINSGLNKNPRNLEGQMQNFEESLVNFGDGYDGSFARDFLNYKKEVKNPSSKKKASTFFLSFDGPNDSPDENDSASENDQNSEQDSSNIDIDDVSIDDDVIVENQDEPLNSADDVSEEETDLFESDNERIEQYESEERQSKLKHTEQLLHSIMLAINNIIVEQVASHTCQKIEPDMREYLAKLTSIIKPSSEEKLAKAKEMQKMLNLDVSASQIPFLFYMPPKERAEFKKSEVIQKRKIIEDLLSKYNRLPESDKSRYETLEEYLQDQDMKLRIIVRKIEHDERRKKSQKTRDNFSKSKKYQKLVETEKEIRKKRSEDRNMMYQDYVRRSRSKRSNQAPLILKFTT